MSTPPVMSINDELLAELEEELALGEPGYNIAIDPGHLRALLAHIVDLKQQLVAAGITAENCEMFRRDSQRLNKLDIIGYAYGFQDMHEGNRWMIDGPYCDIRAAIDGIQEAAP